MGFFDDLLKSDAEKLEDAHNDGQDSGAHSGPLGQVLDRYAVALGNALADNGEELTDAFVKGQENGSKNQPED